MKRRDDQLVVSVSDSVNAIDGMAQYIVSDFTLRYSHLESSAQTYAGLARTGAWRHSGDRVFVTAGFVTLIFEGSPLVLTSLESYGNFEKWRQVRITVPASRHRGALVLMDDRVDDQRISLATTPIIESDIHRTTVRVRLAMQDKAEYFEVGGGLIAGIESSTLVELIFLEVRLK